METAGVSSVQARRSATGASSPEGNLELVNGGVAGRARTGAAGVTTPDASDYTTATKDGDDRTRTGGLSPDKRVLCSSELRPQARKDL
jgi:hypothetical protein